MQGTPVQHMSSSLTNPKDKSPKKRHEQDDSKSNKRKLKWLQLP
ncbi:hypothetical protein SynMVIR181_02633 [Synechococcus sp. MVIR-18-1]|nr:hypothetical protein SynMVIR181_02633 [Synechococcus sp. MVIR-18-1]